MPGAASPYRRGRKGRAQQNEAGAGAEGGDAFGDAGTKRFEHSQVIKQLPLYGGLAAGEYQAVQVLLQIGRLPQLDGGAAEG